MPDTAFPDWFTERVSECVSRLEAGLVERGDLLSPEDDQAGETEARTFIESSTIPDCSKRCAYLFPRLWAAKRLVDRSILNPNLRIWEELDRPQVLEVLLLATWPERGRKKWESARPGGFRFG